MRATILVAGFSRGEADDATRVLLQAGACVLHTPDVAAALAHLEGGTVDAVVVSAALRQGAPQLKARAGALGLAILVADPPLQAADVTRLVDAALKSRG